MTTGAEHRVIPSFFIGRIIRETFLTVSLNLRDPYDFQFKQCATLHLAVSGGNQAEEVVGGLGVERLIAKLVNE